MDEYRALPDDEQSESFLGENHEDLPQFTDRRPFLPVWVTKVSLALNVLLFVISGISFAFSRQTSGHSSQIVYSPAQSAVRYVSQTFAENGLSRYAADGPEADAAWHDLYAHGISVLSEEEAKQMVVRSYPWVIEGQPTYLTELAVYHQLHCVNMFRKHLLSNDTMADTHHLVHCIDDLREAIQCASDITPLFAQPNPYADEADAKLGPLLFYTNTPHSCRDFERVQEWARERRVPPGAIAKSAHENDVIHEV
ncbi:hypothetical protein MSAN_02000100 [Mycena sanguinolenta]|uniref:Uncharacterized protein n=1 Tax=Mycena sanguinolenta TaxID=230812 RepID=A0A8H6XJP8_9AGAR|nr:hypothetical protein MSAN_02000100 [Mycena sanguinolenta]